nr:hypothetical protein [Tanacetum cinerariifolium]
MSSASSVVTYTSVYTDSEPGRVFWGANEELSDRDDDDGDSSGDDDDDEDEDEEDEEEENLASADFVVVIPIVELVSPPEGIEPALIDAVTATLPSPPLPPPLYIPPPVDRRDDVPNTEMPPRNRRQVQMIESLLVMGDMRREMDDMQAKLLALREQPRRARQPGSNDSP